MKTTKSSFFEETNKIDKPLATLTKAKKEKVKQNHKWERSYHRQHKNIKDPTEHCERLYDTKFNN